MKLYISSFISAFLFAIGLGVSGMMSPKKVKGFFAVTETWDPSLGLVMVGAYLVTFLSFHFIPKLKKSPLFTTNFSLPTNSKVDFKLVFGSVLFGIGWAIAGVCPGPAFANIPTLSSDVIIFIVTMIIAQKITKKFF